MAKSKCEPSVIDDRFARLTMLRTGYRPSRMQKHPAARWIIFTVIGVVVLSVVWTACGK